MRHELTVRRPGCRSVPPSDGPWEAGVADAPKTGHSVRVGASAAVDAEFHRILSAVVTPLLHPQGFRRNRNRWTRILGPVRWEVWIDQSQRTGDYKDFAPHATVAIAGVGRFSGDDGGETHWPIIDGRFWDWCVEQGPKYKRLGPPGFILEEKRRALLRGRSLVEQGAAAEKAMRAQLAEAVLPLLFRLDTVEAVDLYISERALPTGMAGLAPYDPFSQWFDLAAIRTLYGNRAEAEEAVARARTALPTINQYAAKTWEPRLIELERTIESMPSE